MTVGETCTPARESRHEAHPAMTTIIEHPLPRVGEALNPSSPISRHFIYHLFSTVYTFLPLPSVVFSVTKYGMASSSTSVTISQSKGNVEIASHGGIDSSPILITSHKLNGHNYLQWSQSVMMFICGKGKDDYLTSEAAMPEVSDPSFKRWKSENNMIMSWLINSMNNDIGENFLLFGTANDIWDAAKETYSSSENTSDTLIYLKYTLGSAPTIQPCTRRLWNRIEHLNFSSDSIKILISLGAVYSGQNLYRALVKPFLKLGVKKAGKKVMMGSSEPTLDASALAAHASNSVRVSENRTKKERPWCDHCRKAGHYKETCWKIYGKPADWKPRSKGDRESHAHAASTTDNRALPEPNPFSKEQIEILQKLFDQATLNSNAGTSLVAQKETHSAFAATNGASKPWIIDTGASDHMTGDASMLQDYKAIINSTSVRIADGSHTKIAGTGSIKLIKELHLNSVLYVPNLACNLLSISKFTRDQNCVTKFYPNMCVFQDLDSGKTIGSAELCSGLYLLKSDQSSFIQDSRANCAKSNSPSTSYPHSIVSPNVNNDSEIVLLHYRLDEKQIEHETQPPVQETEPNPSSCEDNTERKGVRSCTTNPIAKYVSYDGLSSSYRAFVSSLDNIHVPNNIQEALSHPGWKRVVHEEINALEKNDTWVITDHPAGKQPVGCKWIFTIKYKADGSVERLKARLVTKGFTQSYGIDYLETFAPIAKLNTIIILLSLAVNLDWYLYQLDIKNTFLNGDLEEEVFMEVPQGLDLNLTGNKVCKLKKSLYGLKQSPRAWFDRFAKAVVRLGYTQCQADHTLFLRTSQAEKISLLIVYVDDIILSRNDEEELQKLKKQLAQEFEVKDLGNLKYFLGMEVARSKKGIVVSQRKYTLDLLKETGMIGCKPVNTPMDPYKKLGSVENSVPVNRGRYQRLVGRLIYLSHTRPDIGFAVSAVSQFMHNPTEEHMDAVFRILKSSAEAEFRALANGICEGIWIKRVLKELGVCSPSSILMRCDNQAAINIAKNPVHHDRTKHVEIDRHFILEKVTSGSVELKYIPTRQQIADILTKALPRPNFEDLSNKLGLYDIHTPT
ncbi:reverse transcriptase Ty1/copia-type domain-containing protein [Citrus sinensis]|uniref:Reverse transcriptase Ty1/copia-type domain-containing protein n=1 Tax=Citrus sinensis TaxID=2711 RepID=A0ACB8IHT9_CITSI|nr:reverse transcriptase Ty1/copia-type domain-containing protein [Citrus sinensis]